MRSNCLEWNPMEPMNFVVGNEDHNCYSFDMRKLDRPTMIHKGHVGAVLSVAWASTGREFVSGSYDRTVRIWNSRSGASRDTYYAKRMQRVFTVNFTADSKFVLSGSDDTNVRIWKARSNEKLGQTAVREERAMAYKNALVKKFQHMPQVKNIMKQRNLPKFIKKQGAMKQLQKEGSKRKEENIIKHSKAGSVERKGERDKVVVRQHE
jgi:WD repeat and SOF domain-containing protein 1